MCLIQLKHRTDGSPIPATLPQLSSTNSSLSPRPQTVDILQLNTCSPLHKLLHHWQSSAPCRFMQRSDFTFVESTFAPQSSNTQQTPRRPFNAACCRAVLLNVPSLSTLAPPSSTTRTTLTFPNSAAYISGVLQILSRSVQLSLQLFNKCFTVLTCPDRAASNRDWQACRKKFRIFFSVA